VNLAESVWRHLLERHAYVQAAHITTGYSKEVQQALNLLAVTEKLVFWNQKDTYGTLKQRS
jgi:hypothetical protein